jgi:hypothetical protein
MDFSAFLLVELVINEMIVVPHQNKRKLKIGNRVYDVFFWVSDDEDHESMRLWFWSRKGDE